ncbi:CGNR zinc finger domain-containing protein [Rothia sp. AR01]|uniref:CGNR zinc finger domain-containing protein n=1 Tax=Rothia santali TaxID=2949643 RepID=A0A9X2KGT8_9MICC|nr:CGNR zinc finger domain-containing protein [Rothia santali]MCP3424478.1 CGNR zinc finger domain-containing protein [Rothia santali]
MPLHVPQIPVQTVVEFVNEWAAVPQEVSTRAWEGYPAWESEPRRVLRSVWPPGIAEPNDALVATACDRVYPVFTGAWPGSIVERLNTAFDEAGLRPRLDVNDEVVHLTWVTDRPERLMFAVLVASLVAHVGRVPRDRLGICESSACADVLIDRSPTRTKHYCSARCQTRERVKAYRARTS